MDISEMRIAIVEATIQEFNEKGLKFTMDDIAKRLSMSKKTIYTVFRDKNTLAAYMIDYIFDSIKESEKKILDDESLSSVEKLRKVLLVMPDKYQNINLQQIGELKDKYPALYERIAKRIESDWEPTLDLLTDGIKEGMIRPISPFLFKSMVEATLEHFFSSNVLALNHITYEDALQEVLEIMMEGILIKK